MSRARLLPPWLRAGWRSAMGRLDEMPERERYVLLVGALALVAAAELLVVLPARATRLAMAAAGDEQARSEADAAATAAAARATQTSTLQALLAQLDHDLSLRGLGRSAGEPLAFLLGRALAQGDARVLGLRELAIEDVDAAALHAPQPAAEAASASATLYRHRFELTLAGDVAALTEALRRLDQQARPLRIERVRLGSRDGHAVEAAITLSVIGTQRSWLSL
jgi:hypothetical protein